MWYTDWLFGDEIVILIAVPKEETTSRITQVIFLRKTSAQQNQKFGAIVFLLRGKLEVWGLHGA